MGSKNIGAALYSHVYVYMYNIKFVFDKESTQTTTAWQVVPWVMGLMAFGICAAISLWWARRPSIRKRIPRSYPAEDSCEPGDPMMRTTTIRDMIDLTTSGSGSGELKSIYLF